jgi:hypothetical protein
MSDLKPCPFCDCAADIVRGPAGCTYVRCQGCGATSDDSRGVEKWSTRTPDPRITQLEAANAQLEADRVELVERAASAWRKVQQANAVGDPHGFSFHARELTATLSRIGEDGK